MQQHPQLKSVCLYNLQGRCLFGKKCHKLHRDLVPGYLIRHAESLFNATADAYSGNIYSPHQAQDNFQFDPTLIDCPITSAGCLQAESILTTQHFTNITTCIDLIFVSPLNRALQTVQKILQTCKIMVKAVIVLPELTEVLSKMCDFSTTITEKSQRYPNYDFSAFPVQSSKSGESTFWQDELVDPQYQAYIDRREPSGARYIKILKKIFPIPLENEERCFERSTRAVLKMRNRIGHARNVFVVAHNRILKYIGSQCNHQKQRRFKNCELRPLWL